MKTNIKGGNIVNMQEFKDFRISTIKRNNKKSLRK